MKQTFSLLFVPFGLIFLLSACSTTKKIQALKPAPNYSTELVYDKQTSFLNLPIEIAVSDLQNQTNKYLSGLIYEDNSLEGDNLMMKIWKQAPIIIAEKNGRLEIELPLKVWVRVRYGIEKFGFSAYDTRELNLNGKVRISTSVSFQNWKLNTNTQILGIDWVENPSISIAGQDISITYLINPALSIFKPKLTKMMDDAIAQSLDIKPYVLQALDQISKPMEVDKTYHVWFAMQPLEIYTQPAVIANKKISIGLGMKAYLETSVNSKPTLSFDKTKLTLSAVDKMPTDFHASLAGIVTYSNAADLMQKNFVGQQFQSGKRAVTIKKVDLWGKDGKLIVELAMTGSVNGSFYLSGTPMYNPDTKEIYLDQVNFVLDSKNKLLKLGDWLVHGIIAKKIQQSCTFSIASQLSEAEKIMKTYLNNYQPIKGVNVSGNITGLNPDKIVLTPNAIVAIITAKGQVVIRIDGLE